LRQPEAASYAIHPALLDSILHALLPGASCAARQSDAPADAGQALLPFAWSGVRVHSTGATALRAKMSRVAGKDHTWSIEAVDAAGSPVLSADELTLRPIATAALCDGDPTGNPARALYRMEWSQLTRADDRGKPRASHVPRVFSVPVADEPLRDTVGAVLAEVQNFLAEDPAAGTYLVVHTRGGAAVSAGEDAPSALAHAAVWGLVRSAQTENPDRLVLLDTEFGEESCEPWLDAVLTSGESQVAVRRGTLFVPRLTRAQLPPTDRPAWDPAGTVLITGGTGTLGALAARHLVTEHGIRHLLLVSRSGPEASGACELAAQLAALGATASIRSCDVADARALSALLGSIPPEHPLRAVIHTAGVLDDGVIGHLNPERLDTVLRAKADAVWTLHTLTRELDLTAFVLYSSVVGQIGNGGQANYAAANMYLGALARHRRALGLAATSIAWGLWGAASGMTADLDGAEVRHMGRNGVRPLDPGLGMRLFDAAVAQSAEAELTAMRFDPAAARLQASAAPGGSGLPPVLRRLVPRRTQKGPDRTAEPTHDTSTFAERIRALNPADREALLTRVLGEQIAAVLGHDEPVGAAAFEQPFRSLGFDSLTAVEVRNRLNNLTGLRLPATVVFDFPTPRQMIAYLGARFDDGRRAEPETSDSTGAREHQSADTESEPIAIIAMAARYPGGVDSPEALWRLVAEGADTVGAFPGDRGWDLGALYNPDRENIGTSYTREGSFLYSAADFDPAFFGISPREALAMDPQQRLLLEVAWEAFERAGIDPATLKNSRTGVFAGAFYHDYAPAVGRAPEDLVGTLLVGNSGSVISGRIAYQFGLTGPALTVDTACSSSLVAMHLAVGSLRSGECEMALAGGVAVMATANTFVEFARQGGLAADGRCKAFAEAADGTGWGEGVGLVVLERLSVARERNHRVLAVIRGTAVNQDGASNGLTAPNGPSQQRVIRAALADAGLSGADVDAVEAHGTGTRLGDPIEAQALLATYGQERAGGEPLWLGSVKSNIGHTQAAAGVAGVIKMVMALRAGVLPATLHVDAPTSHVDWSQGSVALLTHARRWPTGEGRLRRAGVSAFGVSGTNAHVILEEAPGDAEESVAAPPEETGAPKALVLSARTDAALRAQAGKLADYCDSQAGSLAGIGAVARELVVSRGRFSERAVIVGGERDALVAGLRAFASQAAHPDVVAGSAADAGVGRVAFVFPGQGQQWVAMGARLLAESAVFAQEIARIEAALAQYVDWSLSEVLRGEGKPEALEQVDVVQPALFAVMAGLARMWREAGVVPDAVVGHSQGEIAAAYVAGLMPLEDALRVVTLRSRLIGQRLWGLGGMLSIAGPIAVVEGLIADVAGVEVAAVNSAESVVVAGEVQGLENLAARAAASGLRVRMLSTNRAASHTRLVEPVKDELLKVLEGVRSGDADVRMYSTAQGGWVGPGELDAEYWYRNMRQPVRFADAVAALAAEGYTAFVECSAHPVLTVAVEQVAAQGGGEVAVIASLKRDHGGSDQMLRSIAESWVRGVAVDWAAVVPEARPVPDLPTYPFQHRRFWLTPDRARDADPAGYGLAPTGHPLAATAVDLPDGAVVLTGRLTADSTPWLADHVVQGAILVSGNTLAELAVAAGHRAGTTELADFTLVAPLVVPKLGALSLRVSVAAADEAGHRAVTVHTRAESGADGERPKGGDEWREHAVGLLCPDAPDAPDSRGGTPAWTQESAEEIDLGRFFQVISDRGYDYGLAFRSLQRAWYGEGRLHAVVSLPDDLAGDCAPYRVHPVLLDAALLPLLTGMVDDPERRETLMPFSWAGMRVHAMAAGELRVTYTPSSTADTWALEAVDSSGRAVLSIDAVALRPVDGEELRRALSDLTLLPDLQQPPGEDATARRAVPPGPIRPAEQEASSSAERLRALDPAERGRALLDLVCAQAADVLGHDGSDAIGQRQAFRELGFDSLSAVQLRNRIATVTGMRLPATLVFDYPNPARLVDHLLDRMAQGDRPERDEADVLSHLAALERYLSAEAAQPGADGPEGPDHEAVLARLAALLNRAAPGGAGERAASDGLSALEDASDAELFALVDDLGQSAPSRPSP
jgi:acyl transferase domain-containing protein/acyl carrier protein/NADP-dependent 3-hydroxy acid dehydrogenase YdfG